MALHHKVNTFLKKKKKSFLTNIPESQPIPFHHRMALLLSSLKLTTILIYYTVNMFFLLEYCQCEVRTHLLFLASSS